MDRQRWLPAFTLAGLMAFSSSPFSAEPGTGEWLLESCKGDYGDNGKAFCLGYTMGLADLMLGQQRICVPGNTSSEQIRRAVEQYLTNRPDRLQQHPVLLVIEALDSTFACK